MIIKTDPTIRSLHGKFPKSNLIMQGPNNKFFTHAKSYAKPKTASVIAHQSLFKAESTAIFNCLKNSSTEFKNDLKLYASIYNKLFSKEDKLSIPYHNFFTTLCYASQKSKGYDLTDLTVDNFYYKTYCTGTIKCIIAEGYLNNLPAAYFISNNFSHDISSGEVVACGPPPPPSEEFSGDFYVLTEIITPPARSLTPSEFLTQIEIFTPNVQNPTSSDFSCNIEID